MWVQGRWGGRNTRRERGGKVNVLLPPAGFIVWAEIGKKRIGGQQGTMVIWPGAQDPGVQAAHIPALSLRSPICERETRSLEVRLSCLGMQSPGAEPPLS